MPLPLNDLDGNFRFTCQFMKVPITVVHKT